MLVIVTFKIKDKNIFNTIEFVIENIYKDCIKVDGKVFEIREFFESFIPSFCVTVFKHQGAEIEDHYNILDCNSMDKKQLYPSLSRTTKLRYIHLDTSTLYK